MYFIKQGKNVPRKLLGFALLLSCLILGTSVIAGDMKPEKPAAPNRQILREFYFISMLRLKAVVSTDAFKKWMLPPSDSSWQTTVEAVTPHASPAGISDFFASAIALCGKSRRNRRCWGFYNLWSDVILLFELEKTADSCMIDNFVFVPGEIFRKQVKNRLSANCPRENAFVYRYLKTEKVFNSLFGDNPQALDKISFTGISKEGLLKNVQAAFTMQLFNIFSVIQDNAVTSAFHDIANTIRSPGQNDNSTWVEKQYRDAFYKIPQTIRQNFILTYWEETNDRTVFAFANKLYPSLAVFATAETTDKKKIKITPCDLRLLFLKFRAVSNKKPARS